MNVVIVASEMRPFSKTGGLADVAGALPVALAERGHRVWAISPRYRHVDGARQQPERVSVELFGMDHEVGLSVVEAHGVQFVLVDHVSFQREGIYGDVHGVFGDNLFRYALLSRAAIEAVAAVEEPVVFHANDWHTGLLPVFLEAIHRPRGEHLRSAVVLSLHNLKHQGIEAKEMFGGLHIDARHWPTCDMDGLLNPLKAGIVSADALVAVSPSYSLQIQEDQGFGLEPVLRSRSEDLVGVLNGIDPSWDPATDPHLAARFSADDLHGKSVCKAALQRELGLPERPDVPLLGLISRLDAQKGIDLVEDVVPWLLQDDVQLVMLGSGARRFEHFFREIERRWPTKARGWVGFNESLAHRIEAGADIFLMPSRFEPCGLNQMYSMRYGTVPVVHATGGLADTVVTVDPTHDRGTGWAFAPFTSAAFSRAIGYALQTYREYPKTWAEIRRRGMTTDFSWDHSARLYEEVYQRALSRRAQATS
ncbi:MAG: glycogen synthase [Myxococcales bacterium]|nr:glycogen synthase [Myxococcales bacterium]